MRGYAIAEPGLKTRLTCSRGIATGAEITTSDTTTATTSGSTAAEPKRLPLWVHIIPKDGATRSKQTLARLLGRQTKVDHLVRPELPPLGLPMTCSVDDLTASPAWWMGGSKRQNPTASAREPTSHNRNGRNGRIARSQGRRVGPGNVASVISAADHGRRSLGATAWRSDRAGPPREHPSYQNLYDSHAEYSRTACLTFSAATSPARPLPETASRRHMIGRRAGNRFRQPDQV